MKEVDEDGIAISLIKQQIQRCQYTIDASRGPENLGVRISARGKMVMLENLIIDINETRKRMSMPPAVEVDPKQLTMFP